MTIKTRIRNAEDMGLAGPKTLEGARNNKLLTTSTSPNV
jgi:hypothetical protein